MGKNKAELERENQKLKEQVEVLEESLRKMSEQAQEDMDQKCCPYFERKEEQDHTILRHRTPGKNCGECAHWSEKKQRCPTIEREVRRLEAGNRSA